MNTLLSAVFRNKQLKVLQLPIVPDEKFREMNTLLSASFTKNLSKPTIKVLQLPIVLTTFAVYLQQHRSSLRFKALLQVSEGG